MGWSGMPSSRRKPTTLFGRNGISAGGGVGAGKERNVEVLEIDTKFGHLLGLTDGQVVRHPRNSLPTGPLAKPGYRLMWHCI